MSGVFPLIMDALVIVLLAGTIFYAVRLSRSIQVFRNSRKEMEKLLADLASHIDRAEDAIEGLRSNARQAGRDLQVQINDARGLSEELQIMSESGNRLAGRLEQFADGASGSSRRSPATAEPAAPPPRRTKEPPAAPRESGDPLSAFAIRDPEFDEDLDSLMSEDGLMQGDFDDEGGQDGLGSQAERDLYEALRGRKKTGAGGV